VTAFESPLLPSQGIIWTSERQRSDQASDAMRHVHACDDAEHTPTALPPVHHAACSDGHRLPTTWYAEGMKNILYSFFCFQALSEHYGRVCVGRLAICPPLLSQCHQPIFLAMRTLLHDVSSAIPLFTEFCLFVAHIKRCSERIVFLSMLRWRLLVLRGILKPHRD
jgi:hypothetical protein